METETPADESRAASVRDISAELAALLKACAAGEQMALKSLYRQTSAHLFAVLLRMLKIHALAQDTLQASYAVIWKNSRAFHVQLNTPLPWMAQIARQQAHSRLQNPEVRQEIDLQQAGARKDPQDKEFGPDLHVRRLHGHHNAIVLAQALDGLGSSARHCLVQAYCEGYGVAELAQQLSTTEVKTRSWIQLGLHTLYQTLAAHKPEHEWDRLAGEYVLGTLDQREQKLYASILRHDIDFRERVAWWQHSLAPLDDGLQLERPDHAVWHSVQRELDVKPTRRVTSITAAGRPRLASTVAVNTDFGTIDMTPEQAEFALAEFNDSSIPARPFIAAPADDAPEWSVGESLAATDPGGPDFPGLDDSDRFPATTDAQATLAQLRLQSHGRVRRRSSAWRGAAALAVIGVLLAGLMLWQQGFLR